MSRPAVDAVDVAVLAGAALEAAGVRYFLGGSLASSMQGEPRSTNDVDFVVEMAAWKVARLTTALGPDFSVDEPALRSSLVIGQSANVFYLPLFMKIDLIPRGTTPFDESEFERRTRVVVHADGSALWVKSPEDTVLRKLWWYQQGGGASERQWRDVVAVIRANKATIDRAYLARWAPVIGVDPLLERADAESEKDRT